MSERTREAGTVRRWRRRGFAEIYEQGEDKENIKRRREYMNKKSWVSSIIRNINAVDLSPGSSPRCAHFLAVQSGCQSQGGVIACATDPNTTAMISTSATAAAASAATPISTQKLYSKKHK